MKYQTKSWNITSLSAWSFPISRIESLIACESKELLVSSSLISLSCLLILDWSCAILSSNFACHSFSSSSVSNQSTNQEKKVIQFLQNKMRKWMLSLYFKVQNRKWSFDRFNEANHLHIKEFSNLIMHVPLPKLRV